MMVMMRKGIQLQEDLLLFCSLEVTQFKEVLNFEGFLKEEGERF